MSSGRLLVLPASAKGACVCISRKPVTNTVSGHLRLRIPTSETALSCEVRVRNNHLMSTALVDNCRVSTSSRGVTSSISVLRGFMGGTPVSRAAW